MTSQCWEVLRCQSTPGSAETQGIQGSAATGCFAAAAAAATGVVHAAVLPGELQRGIAGALLQSDTDWDTTPWC